MEAGALRESIAIMYPLTNTNAYGERTDEWFPLYATVRASFEPLLGKEYFSAKETQSLVEVKFRIRYRQGISNTYRVLHRGITYDILSVIDTGGHRRELLLYCMEV